MQNQLQIFENKEFGKVRVVEINGQPWWVLADVCKALELTTPTRVAERLDDDEVSQTHIIDGIGRKQKTSVITESGLYAVILRSDKPTAKAFRRWITSDILPSLRKNGAYITEETLYRMRNDSVFSDELLQRLSDERAKNTALLNYVDKLAPKARYYDLILQCETPIPISIIAKDYGMTAIAFNKVLNDYKIQYKIGKTWLLCKEHSNNGYTISKTYQVQGKEAAIHTCWTQKGRKFIYEILKKNGILPQVEQKGGNNCRT